MNEPIDKPTSSNEHTSSISRLCACETCVAARSDQPQPSQQSSDDKPDRKGKGRSLAATVAVVALVAVIVGAFLLWPESNSSIIENESEVAQTIALDDIDPKAAAALEIFVSYLQNSNDGSGGGTVTIEAAAALEIFVSYLQNSNDGSGEGTSTAKAALAAFVERGAVDETVSETEDEPVLTGTEVEVDAESADSCALAAPLSSRLITPEGATSLIEADPVEEVC